MTGDEIATVVMNGIGNLAPLAASLIGASKEQTTAILTKMRAEVELATSILRAGGAMDDAFAASDAALDAKIAAVAGVKTDP
jgi:uncharacterized protein (DUF1800 family)